MANPTDGFKKRRRPLRKRIRGFWSFPFGVKQCAWRVTAAWFWFYGLAVLFGQRALIRGWGHRISAALIHALTGAGFAPSNPLFLSTFFWIFWLFLISGFSWAQVLGFFVYVPFAPLLIFFRKGRRDYKKTRADSFQKLRRQGVVIPRPNISFVLVLALVLWFALYGRAQERSPLLIAMLITGILFVVRVNKAIVYASMVDLPSNRWIDNFFRSCQEFVRKSVESIKDGKVQDLRSLNLLIFLGSWWLRVSRFVSRWFYGKTARRRAALTELIRFMGNLAILGGLSVLFWAFVIKYFAHSPVPGMTDSLLASASRVIPGIPDSSALRVSPEIQALSSVTAWLIFVLYAGPVASLFPEFREKIVGQTSQKYIQLRYARKKVYRYVDALRIVRELLESNPELVPLAKAAIFLRQQTDLRKFLLGQPDFVRALLGAPETEKLFRTVGVKLPDLNSLIDELPDEPITNGAEGDGSLAGPNPEVAEGAAVARGDTTTVAGESAAAV